MKKAVLKTLFVTLISFWAIADVYSQKEWSLQDCIEYAMENNLSIKQQELTTELSENSYKQSRAERFPSLNARVSPNLNYGRSIDPITNLPVTDNIQSMGYSVSSSVTLFNGFQTRNTIERNRLNLMAAHKDVEKIRNDISLNIASAYLQILFNYELLEIAREQLEITNQQVVRTKALVEAGELAQGDLLEIKAQASSDNLRVMEAKNRLDISYLELTQLLELPETKDFKIIIPDFSATDVSQPTHTSEEVYSKAVEIQPHVESARLDRASASRQLSIAKGRRSPSLSLSASYSSNYRRLIREGEIIGNPEPFWDQIVNNQGSYFSLSLSIPIFNARQINTAISNAQVNALSSDYALQQTKNRLLNEIEQAYMDAMTSFENYLATEKALESMEEAFRHTEERFELGMINIVDYNHSKTQLAQAQSDLLRAKYEYIFSTNILEFYLGEPIDF